MSKQTLIIPVTKKQDGNYMIVIASPLWNDFQSLILNGADKKDLIIEFHIEEEKHG